MCTTTAPTAPAGGLACNVPDTVCTNPGSSGGQPTGTCVAQPANTGNPGATCTNIGASCAGIPGGYGFCGVGATCDSSDPFVSGQASSSTQCNTGAGINCQNPADDSDDNPTGVCQLGPAAGSPCTVVGQSCAGMPGPGGFGFCAPDLICGNNGAICATSADCYSRNSFFCQTPLTTCSNPGDDAQGNPTGTCLLAPSQATRNRRRFASERPMWA
ncbi:hypothetical protein RQP46_000699 [Phenoliferia psychrophenolica]